MVENVMDVVMLAYENWFSLLSLAYFLFPANLLIYGANDLADGDTDALNDKK
ncbi:hypothetical protein GW750_05765 [bacterium]|nr:hypothetical protein [bacterium]